MAIAYVDVEAEKSRQSQPGLLTEVRATRVYHIWIVLAVYILCEPSGILLPHPILHPGHSSTIHQPLYFRGYTAHLQIGRHFDCYLSHLAVRQLKTQSFFQERSRLWPLNAVDLQLFRAAIAILLPAKPQIYTNFFASERAGYLVKCESYGKAQEPSVSLQPNCVGYICLHK